MAVRFGNEPGGRSADGAYFLDDLKQELEPLPIVGQVRGVGMWLAVDFTTDKNAKNAFADDTVAVIVKLMYEKGVIASAIGTAFELAPQYTVSRSEVGLIMGIASEAIVEAARGRGLF